MTLVSETQTTLQELHSGGSSLRVQIVKIIPLPSYSREPGVGSEPSPPSPQKSGNRKRKEALIPPRDKNLGTLFWRNPYIASDYGLLIVSHKNST